MTRIMALGLVAMLVCWGALLGLPIKNIISEQGEEGEIVIDGCALNEHMLTVAGVDISFTDHFLVAIGVDDDVPSQVQEMDTWIKDVVRGSVRVLGDYRAHTVVCASVHDFKGTTHAAWVRDLDKAMPGKVHWDHVRKVAYCIVNDYADETVSPAVAKRLLISAAFGYAQKCQRPFPSLLQNAITQYIAGDVPVNREAFHTDLRARKFLESPALATVDGQLTDGIRQDQVLAAQVAIGDLLAVSPDAVALLVQEQCEHHWGYQQCLKRLDQFASAAGIERWSQSYGCFQEPKAGLWGFHECGPQGSTGSAYQVVARDGTGRIPAVRLKLIDVCTTVPPVNVPEATIYSIPFSTFRRDCSSADWFLLRAVINGKRYGIDYVFDQ